MLPDREVKAGSRIVKPNREKVEKNVKKITKFGYYTD